MTRQQVTTTNGSWLLLQSVKDLRWSNGNPVKRDWLAAMLADIEQQALERGFEKGVNAVRRYDPDAVEGQQPKRSEP